MTVGPEYWIKVPEGWKLAKKTGKENRTEFGGESAEAEQQSADDMSMQETVSDEVISEVEEDVLPMEDVAPVETEPMNQEELSMAGAGVGAGIDGTSTAAAAEGRDVYTEADGIVQVTTNSVKGSHTGYYLFDKNGIMVTGKKTVQPGTPGYMMSKEGELYFTEESTAVLHKEYTGTPKTPVTSDLGQQKKNYWLYQDGKFRLYGKSGPNISVKSMNDKYKDTGYLSVNGKYYCLEDDGTPRTGFIGINGSKYFFDPASEIPGEMFMGGWRCMGTNSKGEKWIYFNRKNKGKDKGKAVIHKGNVAITVTPKSKSIKYLLDHNGYILKNRRTKCVDKAWYGSDSQGRIVKDKLVRYGKYRYYFTKNGKQVGWKNVWKQCPTSAGLKYYYFGSTAGCVSEKKGWQKGKAVIHKGNVAITVTPKSKSIKYLLDHNGYILKNRRTKCVDKAWYGSDSQGRIVKEKLVRYGKHRYYFTKNGKQVGWKNVWKQCPTSAGLKYYYFGSTAGCVSEKKGWQKVKWPSGKFLGWFYFRDNGDHYMGRWVGNQYFDDIGKLASGIKTIDGKTYFFEISDFGEKGMAEGKMAIWKISWLVLFP